MKIRKDGLLYLVWKFTHTFTDKKEWEIDNQVSLWRYSWRIVLLTIPTALLIVMMFFVGAIIMGGIIVVYNLFKLITLQGVYWFNFTDRDNDSEPDFKPVYEFKRINQKRIKAKKAMNRLWDKIIPQVKFVDEDDDEDEDPEEEFT